MIGRRKGEVQTAHGVNQEAAAVKSRAVISTTSPAGVDISLMSFDGTAALNKFAAENPTLPNNGVYAAPQLTPEGTPYNTTFCGCVNIGDINWYTHNNPFLNSVCCPCAAATVCCLKACSGFQTANILGDDEVWRKMLKSGEAPGACPDRLRGLYWMQDNTVNEIMLTFQVRPPTRRALSPAGAGRSASLAASGCDLERARRFELYLRAPPSRGRHLPATRRDVDAAHSPSTQLHLDTLYYTFRYNLRSALAASGCGLERPATGALRARRQAAELQLGA